MILGWIAAIMFVLYSLCYTAAVLMVVGDVVGIVDLRNSMTVKLAVAVIVANAVHVLSAWIWGTLNAPPHHMRVNLDEIQRHRDDRS